MSEAEPRRSVRSTKGQHNQRAADPLDQPPEPKRRGSKKSNKRQADPEPEPEEEEEVIRCVCGATSQEDGDPEDPEDPWIACDECHVWQHNVCVGMSVFDEDLEGTDYFCEECKPEAHKELLDGRAKGKKVWEKRRHDFVAEKEKAAEKLKKKAPPKKGKKRQNELPDDSRASHAKSSASPAPEKKSKNTAAAKRKDRHDSADTTTKEPSKLRKVSESQAPPLPRYSPPADLPEAITELPEARQGPAKLLHKSLVFAIAQHEKKNGYNVGDGISNESRAVRLAITIERAVNDHSQQEYTKQCRSLAANLKSNLDLIARLLNNSLTPPMLAVMSSDELQTEKMQQETAAAKERSVRQSIISTDDSQGPRIRKTHKGDEIVDDGADSTSLPQRQLPKMGSSSRPQQSHSRKPSGDPMRVDGQQSPTSNFDINKVLSSVPKSPAVGHNRRPSAPAPPPGPIEDADVDRLLDDNASDDSYHPIEDPDVVWRGQLAMAATADFTVNAKHVAGANLVKTLNVPWTSLLPDKLNVGGRIAMNSATEYLCSLRWSATVDLVIVSLEPANKDKGQHDFDQLYDYFTKKERWAVIGDKRHANVKDTYLVPVPAGTGNQPEFLLNLEDNFLPVTRAENMLLLVIVYRNDEATLQKLRGENAVAGPAQPPVQLANHASPSPAPYNGAQRSSASAAAGPGYSPTTPHVGAGGFAPPQHGQHYGQPQQQMPQAAVPVSNAQNVAQAQVEGEAMARNILGQYASAATLTFLMPHAHQMSSTEWQIIRRVLEQEPRARDDLMYLGQLISRESEDSRQQGPPPGAQNSRAQGQQHPPTPTGTPAFPGSQNQTAHAPPHAPGVSPGPPSQPPRQTPISLPPIAGMPASVHQSYHQAQAERQARDVQSPAAQPAPLTAAPSAAPSAVPSAGPPAAHSAGPPVAPAVASPAPPPTV